MVKWVLAVLVVVVALGVLVWQLNVEPAKKRVPRTRLDGSVPLAADAGAATVHAPRKVVATDAAAEPLPQGLLTADSPEFSRRIDIGIPGRLRASAGRCYDGGLDPDATLKLAFKLRIEGGMVSARDVSVAGGSLKDETTANCMRDAVGEARWREDDLPDFAEDQELFIRLRTLKKYKDPEEQIRDKEQRRDSENEGAE